MSTELTTGSHYHPDMNIQKREEFLKSINVKPDKTEKQAGAEGIPISHLETLLDEVYLGLWQTQNFRTQVVLNEIIGTIDLLVYDPNAKIWICRSGSAAVQIQQASGSAITDIAAKYKNALQKDFPKLETMCLKAAAKRLGKRFGRDLNRKIEDEYSAEYTPQIELNQVIDTLKIKLDKCETIPQLMEVWNEVPNLHDNKHAKKIFNSQKTKINMNGNAGN